MGCSIFGGGGYGRGGNGKPKKQTLTEVMQTWVGHDISEAIKSWGPYTRTTSDGKGGTVYSWEQQWTLQGFWAGNRYVPPREQYCHKHFYTDYTGKISLAI